MVNITLLCDDLLLSIMEFLSCVEIIRISRTNKELYNFFNNHDPLWKVLTERDCCEEYKTIKLKKYNKNRDKHLWKKIYYKCYIEYYINETHTKFLTKQHTYRNTKDYKEFLKYKMYIWNVLMFFIKDTYKPSYWHEHKCAFSLFFDKCPNDILKYILNNTVDLKCDDDGWRPIHYICRYSNRKMQEYIIDRGIDLEYEVEKGEHKGWKPIHFICRYLTPWEQKYIIDKGVDLDCEIKEGEWKGWRPIHFICKYSTSGMIKYIINKGVNLECKIKGGKWKGFWPIHFICKYCTPGMIKYIIDKGVYLECENRSKCRPIHYICKYSTTEKMKELNTLTLVVYENEKNLDIS